MARNFVLNNEFAMTQTFKVFKLLFLGKRFSICI